MAPVTEAVPETVLPTAEAEPVETEVPEAGSADGDPEKSEAKAEEEEDTAGVSWTNLKTTTSTSYTDKGIEPEIPLTLSM